ncbi:DsbA family protein [Belliella kenyensis]|uniref:DsbA family protein n=1 Tax=Belliella kenyensis TaxID=1472724 RepID=A0ABV8ELM0_9BACT|nr:DsbA family oxidoreductase [Belliella kenyensis]MCH7403209.1 DsbA family oxidoreductase [Belliella kenyensis]MDN3604820.1 DsbA family oxidoreductase [Belliella kenyensis]
MKIEIWSDVMCPFCYIGKRRLEASLEKFEHKDKVEIVWKSFLLNPDLKTNPDLSTLEYLSESKGWSKSQTEQIMSQVVDMASQEGLTYHMDRTVVANAKNAHRVLQFAKAVRLGDDMKERLFKAYFTEGENIDDTATLQRLGEEVGLDQEDLKDVLASDQFIEKVNSDIQEAIQIGVRGVPFFVFDNKFAISGAQASETFDQTLIKAWEKFMDAQKPHVIGSQESNNSCDLEGNCNND